MGKLGFIFVLSINITKTSSNFVRFMLKTSKKNLILDTSILNASYFNKI